MSHYGNRRGSSSVQMIIVVALVAGIAIFSLNTVFGSGGADGTQPQTRNLGANASSASDDANAGTMESVIQTARLSGTLDANADGIVSPLEISESAAEGGADVVSTREGFEFYIDVATDHVIAAQTAPPGYIQIPLTSQ